MTQVSFLQPNTVLVIPHLFDITFKSKGWYKICDNRINYKWLLLFTSAFFRIVALAGLCHGVTLDHDEFAVNVSPSQVDVKTAQFVDTTPHEILELVEEDTKEKPYLKYYYSSQKFVPVQELNVVCMFPYLIIFLVVQCQIYSRFEWNQVPRAGFRVTTRD